jgi:hypothetical protein
MPPVDPDCNGLNFTPAQRCSAMLTYPTRRLTILLIHPPIHPLL